MPLLKKSNFAVTNTVSLLTITGTDFYCTAAEGAKFPSTGFYMGVIWSSSSASPGLDATREIVKCYTVSTDRISVVRAQEGTVAKEWAIGSYFGLVNTAGTVQELERYVQNSLLAFAGTTGSSNAYAAVLDPALVAYVTGIAVNIRFTAANTAECTLSINTLGNKYIYRIKNGAFVRIGAGDIIAGMYSVLFYDASLNGGAGGWVMNNPATGIGSSFAKDTSMVFNQATVPTDWVQVTSWATPSSLIIGNSYSSGGGSDSAISWTTALSVATHADHTHTGGSLQFKVAETGFSILNCYDSAGTAQSVFFGSTQGGTTGGAVAKWYDPVTGQVWHTKPSATPGVTGVVSTSSARTHTVTNDTYTPRYVQMIVCKKL